MKDSILNKQNPVEIAERLKRVVMQQLDWSELEYCEFQYEQGLIYLKTYLSGLGKMDECFLNALLRSKIFWNWFKNHWTLRDRCFIIEKQLSIGVSREIYKLMHDGRSLAKDIHPNSLVLKESYSYMMHQLIKKEVQQI